MADLPARLLSWRRGAPPAEERTVVLRAGSGVDPRAATDDVRAAGARVESAGAGAIVAVVSPATLEAVAALPWVLAVEEPRRLDPKRR